MLVCSPRCWLVCPSEARKQLCSGHAPICLVVKKMTMRIEHRSPMSSSLNMCPRLLIQNIVNIIYCPSVIKMQIIITCFCYALLEANLQYESLFVHATNSECNGTLIVFPHGGPHSAYGCEYSTHVAVFYRLGFSVLMLNFRGSIGFGQDSIDSLPGNISILIIK